MPAAQTDAPQTPQPAVHILAAGIVGAADHAKPTSTSLPAVAAPVEMYPPKT